MKRLLSKAMIGLLAVSAPLAICFAMSYPLGAVLQLSAAQINALNSAKSFKLSVDVDASQLNEPGQPSFKMSSASYFWPAVVGMPAKNVQTGYLIQPVLGYLINSIQGEPPFWTARAVAYGTDNSNSFFGKDFDYPDNFNPHKVTLQIEKDGTSGDVTISALQAGGTLTTVSVPQNVLIPGRNCKSSTDCGINFIWEFWPASDATDYCEGMPMGTLAISNTSLTINGQAQSSLKWAFPAPDPGEATNFKTCTYAMQSISDTAFNINFKPK